VVGSDGIKIWEEEAEEQELRSLDSRIRPQSAIAGVGQERGEAGGRCG
jgi:hypothetical protein